MTQSVSSGRQVPTSASTPPITGPFLMNTYAARFKSLFDSMALVPESITNIGNDYTITITPALISDVTEGMAFYITPNADNTGAAQLRVTSSNPYYPWRKADGTEFAATELLTSDTYLVVFVNGEFRTLTATSGGSGGGGALLDFQDFTSSGTWTKPANLDPDSWVLVEIWAGGASGNDANDGGGGGGYNYRLFRASELGSSETVTIGAGGSSDSGGGDSSFGSHMNALGGRVLFGPEGGGQTDDERPGLISGEDNGGDLINITGGNVGGDRGGDGIFGGGGGSVSSSSDGGHSLYGGGGGGGASGDGGLSAFGGDGGSNGGPGSAPAGGGSDNANGARGECRVWVIGAESG